MPTEWVYYSRLLHGHNTPCVVNVKNVVSLYTSSIIQTTLVELVCYYEELFYDTTRDDGNA